MGNIFYAHDRLYAPRFSIILLIMLLIKAGKLDMENWTTHLCVSHWWYWLL